MKPRITLLHHCGRSRGRRDRVDRAKYNVCRHAEGQACQRAERGEIGGLKGRAVRVDHWQPVMTVGCRPPMARQVLQHRENATCLQALGNGLGNSRHLAGLAAIGAVADNGVGAFQGNVGQRQAIDIDAERRKVGRNQMAGEPCGGNAGGRLAVVEVPIARSRGISRPNRRAEPLDTPPPDPPKRAHATRRRHEMTVRVRPLGLVYSRFA